MKNYIKSFFKEEDGAETFEFVLVLGCVAALALVLYFVVEILQGNMEETADDIKDLGDSTPDSLPDVSSQVEGNITPD